MRDTTRGILVSAVVSAGTIVVLHFTFPPPEPSPCRDAILSWPTHATSVVCPDTRHRIRVDTATDDITCVCPRSEAP